MALMNGVGGPTGPLTAMRPSAPATPGIPQSVIAEASAGLNGPKAEQDSCVVSGKAKASGMNLGGPDNADQAQKVCDDVVWGMGGGYGGSFP